MNSLYNYCNEYQKFDSPSLLDTPSPITTFLINIHLLPFITNPKLPNLRELLTHCNLRWESSLNTAELASNMVSRDIKMRKYLLPGETLFSGMV